MPNIYISPTPASIKPTFSCGPEDLDAFCRFHSLSPSSPLMSAKPYCLTPLAPGARHVVSRIDAMPQADRRALSHVVEAFGEHTLALANFYARELDQFDLGDANTLVGAGATASGVPVNRATGFQRALLDYQYALIALNDFERGKGSFAPPRARTSGTAAQLQQAVVDRYTSLDRIFQAELKRAVPVENIGKNRGNALTSAERGLSLAGRKPSRGLYVADVGRASALARMSTGVQAVGNGAVVFDAGNRVAKVYQVRQNGGNWQRAASIEATGFGFGGAAGAAVGRAATSATISGAGLIALKLGLAIGPVGWVVIVGVGIGVGLYAGYKAGTITDATSRQAVELIWDRP